MIDMSSFEFLSLLIATAAALANLGALLFLAKQVGQARVATEAANSERIREWDQRRKESTLQFYQSTLEKRELYKYTLPSDRDGDAIHRYIEEASTDTTKNNAVKSYMNFFEMLATGVKMEVFDIDAVDAFAGSSVTAVWRHYFPWIDRQRELFNAPTLSEQFEELQGIILERNRNAAHRDNRRRAGKGNARNQHEKDASIGQIASRDESSP